MSIRTWFSRRHRGVPQPWARQENAAAAGPQRRFLAETDYLLPKDYDEEARLNFQHHALYLTLGNHYLAPLPPTVRTIVDVGTGTGIWAGEMARQRPDALVLGLDIDPALFGKTPPPHCLLRQGNVLEGLPLPDAFAEFTHQRLLVLAIPDEKWPGVIAELVRVTQVGGWLELVETDAHVQNGGPATERLFSLLAALRRQRGLQGEAVFHLGELLRSAGVQQIDTQEIPLKVGPWGARAGQMMERDIVTAVQALKEPCCAACDVSAQEFEHLLQRMREEWQTAQAYCMIYAVYGRRTAP